MIQVATNYLRQILSCEEGQDLVEYAMAVAVVAFGAMAGMSQVAQGVNVVFSSVATILTAT